MTQSGDVIHGTFGDAAVSGTSASEPRWEELRQVLERAVNRICPSWLEARRDDLVQAAAMRVMDVRRKDAARGLAERDLSRSYLYRVAHSVLVDEIRRHRRRDEVDIEQAVPDVVDDRGDGPDRRAEALEIGRGIQGCLGDMVKDRRLAVTLHLQGHSVPETAHLLGWPFKRTENLVYRGLADLRGCLAGKGLEP